MELQFQHWLPLVMELKELESQGQQPLEQLSQSRAMELCC
jgi:hypothetical protein